MVNQMPDRELLGRDGMKPIIVDDEIFKEKLYKISFENDNTVMLTECTDKYMRIPPDGMHSVSDGYHTFDELYKHRAILFSVICNTYREIAWKSKLHSDGTMYKDMFIVGLDLDGKQATYHYDIELWDIFKVKELERAPEWDGHTPEDAINRILNHNWGVQLMKIFMQ